MNGLEGEVKDIYFIYCVKLDSFGYLDFNSSS